MVIITDCMTGMYISDYCTEMYNYHHDHDGFLELKKVERWKVILLLCSNTRVYENDKTFNHIRETTHPKAME